MAAIYMWFEAGIEILTTTLYPLEVVDAMQLNFDVAASSMSPINQDDLDISGSLVIVTLNQILLSYGPDSFEVDIAGSLGPVVLNQILLSYGPEINDLDMEGSLIQVVLTSLLVTVDTPDEKLQLDFDIYPSGCSMTPV